MKIGINMLFLLSGRGGGIERYARNVISALQRIDQDNEYILFTNRDCRGSFTLTQNFREVTTRASALFRPSKIAWEQTVLPLSARFHKIDVMLSPGNIGPLLPGCPSVVIIHDLIPFLWPGLFTLVERSALQALMSAAAHRSSSIITVSLSSGKDITKTLNIDPAKISVVPGACSEAFVPVPDTSDRRTIVKKYGISAPYILYVASTRPYKNIDGLIKAFELFLRRERTEHSLVITGLAGKAQSDLARLANNLGLKDRIVFAGFVRDEDLAAIYSAAVLTVYPSFYEGFGLPLIESMACGTPVAASNSTSLPEVLGDAGLLFDPGNIEEIAAAMSSVIMDATLRAGLTKKGLNRSKTYSWEKTAMAILSVLKTTGGER